MPKKENLSITIDYVSIVFENATARDVIGILLGLPIEDFRVRKGGIPFKAYTTVYEMAHIKVYADCKSTKENPLGLGCYLVFSGKGCEEFRKYRNREDDVFSSLFSTCDVHFRIRQGGYRVTRIDVAIDDRNDPPYFTIEQIEKKVKKGEFVSRSRSFHTHESSQQEEENANTVYIGDRGSDIYYRFYDKDKEQSKKYDIPYEEIGSWKRTEIQLRREVAQEFSTLMRNNSNTLAKLTVDFLGSNLRFVTKDKNQANKSRWKTSRFWERYLGKVETLKIKAEKPSSSLSNTQNWIQQGGAMGAVKAFLFLEESRALGELKNVSTMLNRTLYSPETCNKIVSHLISIDREDLIPDVYADTKK